MKTTLTTFLLFLPTLFPLGQSAANPPTEIKKVFNYIQKKESLELFGDSANAKPFRPIDWCINDIDGDGKTEVFLLIHPHYYQTAPVQIYQIQKDSSVKRIKESLAPGNTVSRTNEYLDSHQGGYAADIAIDQGATQEQKRKLAGININYGMTIINFPDFLHGEARKDNGGGYIDLSHSGYKTDKPSCAAIQFSKPTAITSGKLKDTSGNYFAVALDKEIWIYKISKIDESGFLEKEITIIKLPKQFKQFSKDGQYISYLNKKGKVIPLELN